jgi:hypothetical protein
MCITGHEIISHAAHERVRCEPKRDGSNATSLPPLNESVVLPIAVGQQPPTT